MPLYRCIVLGALFTALGLVCLPPLGAYAAGDDEETLIGLANGLFQRGFYDMAAEEYQRYLEQFPSGAHAEAALFRLGESEYSLQHHDKALAAFDKLNAQFPQSIYGLQAGLRKGELLYRMKRYDEAKTTLEPLTSEGVEARVHAGALYYLGKTLYETSRLPAAAEKFQKLAETYPDHPLTPYARYQLAFVHLSNNAYEQAAVEFSAVASSEADAQLRMESRYRAGEAYDKIGWFDAAAASYQKLREEFPGTPQAERSIYGYAWALSNAGKHAEAAAMAAEFLQKNPDSPDAPGAMYLRANSLLQQSALQNEAGAKADSLRQAVEIFRKLRETFSNTEYAQRAHYKMAWALHQMGLNEDAEREAASFLDTYKDTPLRGDAAFLLGVLLAARGQYADAYQEFQLVAEKYAESEFAADALYKAAECLVKMERVQEAAAAFSTFAQKYPDHPLAEEAVLRVGDSQALSGKLEEAIVGYEQILTGAPTPQVEEQTLYRMAVTYHRLKQYDKASERFRSLIGKYPQSRFAQEARLRLADHLLHDANQPAEAITEYQAALDLAPTSSLAGRALRGIGQAQFAAEQHDVATDTFLRVIREYPKVNLGENTYAWLGQRLFDAQRWPEASLVFEAMLAAIPEYPNPERILLRIAECGESAGDTESAIKRYAQVVEKAPQSSTAFSARYRMAVLHEGRNEIDQARALYEEVANGGTSDLAARSRFRLGEFFESKEEYDAAARSYMHVAILYLDEKLTPESLWRAAQCFEKTGRVEQAAKAYEELIRDFPESEFATKAKETASTTP